MWQIKVEILRGQSTTLIQGVSKLGAKLDES